MRESVEAIKYPLTSIQKRIWYAQEQHKSSSLFNIGGYVRIKTQNNLHTLRKAIEMLSNNFDVLQARFQYMNHEVYQYKDDSPLIVGKRHFKTEEELRGWCEADIRLPFVMTNSSLCRFNVFTLGEQETGYYVKLHHIIADGWSMKLLTEQIAKNYDYLTTNRFVENAERFSYFDYALKESKLSNKHSECCCINRNLSTSSVVHTISSTKLSGKRENYFINSLLKSQIEEFIQKQNLSLNTFFLGIYILTQYILEKKTTHIIGIPVLGRYGKKERNIFGMFSNTIPVCFNVDPTMLINDFFRSIVVNLRNNFKYQKHFINSNSENTQVFGRGKLYDVCVNYYNTSMPEVIGTSSVHNEEIYCGEQDYAMQMIIRQWDNNQLQLDFDYQTAVFTSNEINTLFSRLMQTASRLIEDANICVMDLLENRTKTYAYLPEKKLFEDSANGATWVDIFVKNASDFPHMVAISKQDEKITYGELDVDTDQLAQQFLQKGIKNRDIVACIMRHDVSYLKWIIAIWKCGAVYLPLDPDIPEYRLQQIIADSGATFVIGNKEPLELMPLKGPINNSTEIIKSTVGQPAYIIYTSGSTDKPKGVIVSHQNLMNYLLWARKTYVKSRGEVFALYSSFSFDFTFTSLLLPLLCLGEIRLYPGHKEHNVFQDIISDKKTTILKITPSHIPLIEDINKLPEDCPIHTIIIGGEELHAQMCMRLNQFFNGKIQIYNEYGPTEATVGCVVYLYNGECSGSVPIGHPIDNNVIYLFDKNKMLISDNEIGEIYISGDSVAIGYHKEENKEGIFSEDPYNSGKRIYKSGDLAYRNDKGLLVYCGRIDDEIKLNGYRVRPGEIEQKILSSGLVKAAAVKAINRNGGAWVCAYIVADQIICSNELLEILRRELPEFMIPKQIIQVPQIPLNKNGKVDRGRLPDPLIQSEESFGHIDSKLLEELMGVVQVLFLNNDLNPSMNFFSIGGDSIKAIQLSSRLSEKGYNLSVKDIMRHPILGNMVKYIHVSRKECNHEPARGIVDQLPNVCWLMTQDHEVVKRYHQSIVIKLNKHEPINKIYRAFSALVQHHDALRINFDTTTKCLYYNDIHLSAAPQIETIYLENTWLEVQNEILHTVNTSFDLANDLLFRVYAIYLHDGVYLFMIFHHLISDGVSLRILLDDLSKLFSELSHEITHELPLKTISYQQYAKEFLEWSKSLKIDNKYWDAYMLESEKTNSILSLERYSYKFRINEDISKCVLGSANMAYHTKGEELLLIALKLTLQETLSFSHLIIEAESHGRDVLEYIDTSRTIGWFSSAYPVNIKAIQGTIRDIIMSYKEQIRSAFKRRYEYGICKLNKAYQFPLVDMARFNYLGNCDLPNGAPFKLVSIFPDNELTVPDINVYPVELDIALINGELHCRIICKEHNASYLANLFTKHLKKIIKHCLIQNSYSYTPSDFPEADLTQQELDVILNEI